MTASLSMPAGWALGCLIRSLPICGAAWSRSAAPNRPTAPHNTLRIAARSLACALGRTKACGRDHLSDMDSRWSLASHGVRRSPGGQAGGPGAARSRSTRLIGGSEQGSINQRRSGVDVKRSLQIAAGGAPANWRKRQVVVASYLRLDQWRDPVSRVYPTRSARGLRQPRVWLANTVSG
jgi:hypothetical protein